MGWNRDTNFELQKGIRAKETDTILQVRESKSVIEEYRGGENDGLDG